MPWRLSDCLLRDGTVAPETVHAAAARQAVYGGALDTALLELDALDEPTLWAALGQATEALLPTAELFENPDPGAAARFDAEWSRRCRAVPVGQHERVVQVLCGEPIDVAGLAAAREELGVTFEVYVVPEVRLAAARQAVYGDAVPPRLLRLLARLLGAQAVRRWVETQPPRGAPATEAPPAEAAKAAPAGPPNGEPAKAEAAPEPTEFEVSVPSFSRSSPTPVGRARVSASDDDLLALAAAGESLGGGPLSDDAEVRLCRVAEDADAEARLPALRVLRARLDRPRVRALAEKLRDDLKGPSERAVLAASALGELRDAGAVPPLMAALQGPTALAQTAHRALVEIAKQDFGTSRRRWTAWWERHQGQARAEWLFDGLSHKAAEIRFSASEELRLLTGEYFGYHFDLPKREREDAAARWRSWWVESQRAR